VNGLLDIPEPIRLAAVFLLGACLGAAANLAAYQLSFGRRPISPWGPRHADAPRRGLVARLPIAGWWALRREAALHGAWFWLRPMLVEAGWGAALAALYWWETLRLGLLDGAAGPGGPALQLIVHTQFAAHALLGTFMLAAALIDIDEQIIPDSITVPGTLAGVLLCTAFPWILLHGQKPPLFGGIPPAFWNAQTTGTWPLLHLLAPQPWEALPAWLTGAPHPGSLVLALGGWWLWCVGLMPRVWYGRFGVRRAMRYFLAKLARERSTYVMLGLGVVGSLGISGVWLAGGRHFLGLLSALMGVALGGGIVWMVRVMGSAALQREAMGFGDVTLMAMIGSFVGWQPCVLIFFFAPFAGVVVGVGQWLVARHHVIPYGPFLCLAAAVVIVRWAGWWDWTWPVFGLGWFVPAALGACLGLMGLLLGLWRRVREALWPEDPQRP